MSSSRYSIVEQDQPSNDDDRMGTTKWKKFKLLMWKNYLLQWRHKLQTVAEIAIPVIFSALLVLIRSLVTPELHPEPKLFPAYPINTIRQWDTKQSILKMAFKILSFKRTGNATLLTSKISSDLVYSPTSEALEKLMELVQPQLGTQLIIRSVSNSSILESTITAEKSFVGVEFPDSYASLTSLPDAISYALRFPSELRFTSFVNNPVWFNWRTDLLFPRFQNGGPRNLEHKSDGSPAGYYNEGFVFIQNMIFKGFMVLKNYMKEDLSQVPIINVQRFPYPPFVIDFLLQGLQALVSLFILLSFVYPCINIIKYITTEKEKQLKEAMKIMGLDSWLHWTAWFVKCFIYMIITVTLMTILLKVRWYGEENPTAVFTYSSGTVLWVFLLIYSMTTITFCFMLSVFFNKASVASACAGLIWFMIYAPYSFIQQNAQNVSLTTKLIVSIFSNAAMGLGFDVVIRFEGSQEGAQWDNLFTPVNVDDNLTLGYIWLMLILDGFVYLFIALYVEKILPGNYGVPEKWNFIFKKQFWCGMKDYEIDENSNSNGVSYINSDYEIDPTGKKAGVQVRGLRKEYSKNKVAVEGLNLDMFEDQITVLLGHNGAGKTTTMSMLTGMISPTSGTAIVNGKDIRKDINSVRASIGLCPQHDILFDDLTVREHIEFYSRLKGLHNDDIHKEIIKFVKLLKLEDKIDARAGSLSGGMKRKLSVGIAMCGNSKVVLCDEPTSGMDPAARRALWDLIQQEKSGRTILLSTHFMDEADVLGDRIAIMAHGQLKAVGTPFFLKKHFGVGYHLICVKLTDCRTETVTNLLRKYIPDIKVQTDIGTELSYLLSEENIAVFQPMLQDLEEHSQEIKIDSYGIGITSMEEVFLKVGSDNTNSESETNGTIEKHSNENGNGNGKSSDAELESTNNFYNYSDTLTLLVGMKLTVNQLIALMMKKILNSYRNWIMLFIQTLIPILFALTTILTVQSWGGNRDLPKLQFSLNTYSRTVTSVEVKPSLDPESISMKIYEGYRNQFTSNALDIVEEDMSTHYLRKSKQFLTRLNSRYLYGATIGSKDITVWFNNQPYHTSPVSLSLVHNAILSAVAGKTCSISVSNQPLPYSTDTRGMMLQTGNNLGFQLAFNVGFAMSFVASFFIIFYIKERITKSKLLQFVSGVNVVSYWVTAFLWDYLIFIGISILLIGTIGAFQENGYKTFNELGLLFLVLLFFGFAVLPLIYIASFTFGSPASGFTKMSIFFIFMGVAMFTVIFSMQFEGFNLRHVSKTLTWIFLAIPHFTLSDAFNNIYTVNILKNVCARSCTQLGICDPADICKINSNCCNLEAFSWEAPGVLRHLVFLFAVGVFSITILMLKEFRKFEILYYKLRMVYRAIGKYFKKKGTEVTDTTIDNNVVAEIEVEDEDVKFEKERINNMSPNDYKNYNLIMKNMTRYYGDFKAVNELCVGIKHSECFGLLGINGAGKTSTFKMLTGDIKISDGGAWVKDISLKTNMKQVHQQIGYCPQFDALIDDLTGRETLTLFSMCRGIPRYKLNDVIAKLADDFNFTKHLDKKVKAYSGGNKRKLSTAVALLGNPVIVFLDEPTTGMDPGAKRNLWDVICNVRDSGKTIILTSHSMEECEALCTRLAIMVNGEFKCLGSTQHLKNKFGEGFLLTVKLKRFSTNHDGIVRTESQEMIAEKDAVKEFIEKEFVDVVLKEEYFDMLTYIIPTKYIKWSEIFGKLEAAKTKLNIDDYSITQSSLEQVFLQFTKKQQMSDES